jgi:cell volume regulation protein A
LATFPLLFDIPGAPVLFDLVFFIVFVSAVAQGWSMPLVARWLGLQRTALSEPPLTLEISSLRHVDGDIVEYTIGERSMVAGRRVKDIALPEGVVIAIIARGAQIIPPQGDTRILTGDHAILVLKTKTKPLVDHIFGTRAIHEISPLLEFPLRPSTTVGDLKELYGLKVEAPADQTLDRFIEARLGKGKVTVGSHVDFAEIALYVRGVSADGGIDRVGMIILPAS